MAATRGAAALLFRHVARDHHGQDRQHPLEKRRIEARAAGRVRGHRTAHVARAEDLAQHIVAAGHFGPFGREDVVQQPTSAELAQKSPQAFQTGRLRLGLLLEAKDGRQQRLRAGRRLGLADAEIRAIDCNPPIWVSTSIICMRASVPFYCLAPS
jgi:hypothetical protein